MSTMLKNAPELPRLANSAPREANRTLANRGASVDMQSCDLGVALREQAPLEYTCGLALNNDKG